MENVFSKQFLVNQRTSEARGLIDYFPQDIPQHKLLMTVHHIDVLRKPPIYSCGAAIEGNTHSTGQFQIGP